MKLTSIRYHLKLLLITNIKINFFTNDFCNNFYSIIKNCSGHNWMIIWKIIRVGLKCRFELNYLTKIGEKVRKVDPNCKFKLLKEIEIGWIDSILI